MLRLASYRARRKPLPNWDKRHDRHLIDSPSSEGTQQRLASSIHDPYVHVRSIVVTLIVECAAAWLCLEASIWSAARTPDFTFMRRKLIAFVVTFGVLAVGLGVGLGVGLTRRSDSANDSSSTTPVASSASTAISAASASATNNGIWKPPQNSSWDYRLSLVPLSFNTSVSVYDIDLFEVDGTTIDELHSAGHRVICYFSAGSYENWRPDNGSFPSEVIGNALDGWEGESWLNTTSPVVRSIMATRIQLAAEKMCDGIDPDNLDAYDNDSGFSLTQADAASYVEWLAEEGNSRNLSVGLKNCGAIAETVEPYVSWVVVEQCIQYEECEQYDSFVDAGKPIFNVEYPKGDTSNSSNVSAATYESLCGYNASVGFMTILKNMNLDAWGESCPYR